MQHSEGFELGLAELLASDDDLTEEVARLTGSTSNDVLNAIAVLATEVAFRLNQRMRARFFDTAEGDDLTRLIVSEFGIERIGATAAIVSLTFSRDDTEAVTIDAGTVVATGDGVRFTTDSPIFWSAGDTSDKVVTATAVELGPLGNVGAETITAIEASLDDDTIVVTNPELAAGGHEEEDDFTYKARTRDIYARFVRATLRAIVLGALEVPQVRSASAYESVDGEGNPSGGVTLAFSDADGYANEALGELVEAELVEWRGAGVYVKPLVAVVREEAISVAADWQPGQATPANALLLKKAIVARVNRLVPRSEPDGVTASLRCQLRSEALCNEAAATVPGCNGVTVLLPVGGGTVTPDPGEVIRTRLDLVTVS